MQSAVRRHPCPYADCDALNAADDRYCARCGRELNTRAMRAAESWSGGWLVWPILLPLLIAGMMLTIRSPQDVSPWVWVLVCGAIVVGVRLRRRGAARSADETDTAP